MVAVLTTAAISRYFGPQLFGDYGYIISMGVLLASFTAFGLERIIIRDVAQVKDDKAEAENRFGTALATRWGLSLIVFTILLVMLFAGWYDSEYKMALIVTTISQFAITSSLMYSSVFKAYEKMEYEVFITFISQLMLLVLIFAGIWLELGFIAIFVVLALASIFKLILSYALCYKKFLRPKFIIKKAEIIYILKQSLILGLNFIVLQAMIRADVLILKAFKDSVEVSMFFAPHSLLIRLNVLPVALATALFPFFSRIAPDEANVLQNAFIKVYSAMFFLGVFIAAIGMIFADQIITLLYGKAFIDSILSFRILLPSLLFLFLYLLLDFVLMSQNKPLLLVPASIGGFLVNVCLALALIPRYGNVGASIASLAGYMALFAIISYSARDIVRFPRGRLLNILLGTLILISGALYFFSKQGLITLTLITLLIFGISLSVFAFTFNPHQFKQGISELPQKIGNLIGKWL